MTHAISDERAREAIQQLRIGEGFAGADARHNEYVKALMMYVAERLPVETKKARHVNWYVPYGARGDAVRNDRVAEDRLPDYIKTLLEDGAKTITISESYDALVR